jgi:CxxC motif-containing protein
MAVKELICICCPRGCHLKVDDNLVVTGNTCPRGAAYGKQEVTNPTRVLTSTVRVSGSNLPLCPVKSEKPIPKGKLFDAMKEINEIHLVAPVKIGQVVKENLAGSGIALVATRNMDKVA